MADVKRRKKTSDLEAPRKIKILITIIPRTKTDFYLSVLEGYDVNLQTVLYARGTAPSDLARMLGVIDDKKAVIVSVVPEDRISEVLVRYEDKYFKTKNGRGIAFTIPISSTIGIATYKFLANLEV
jgi:hypothetical protein